MSITEELTDLKKLLTNESITKKVYIKRKFNFLTRYSTTVSKIEKLTGLKELLTNELITEKDYTKYKNNLLTHSTITVSNQKQDSDSDNDCESDSESESDPEPESDSESESESSESESELEPESSESESGSSSDSYSESDGESVDEVRHTPSCIIKCDKVRILVKYEQSGKTNIVLRGVVNYTKDGAKVLAIVICDNNLLLTTATNLRAQEFGRENNLPQENWIKSGTIKSNASGQYEWKQFEGVLDKAKDKASRVKCEEAIIKGFINTLMVCGHNKRFNNVVEIINKLGPMGFKFVIYIDEADKVITEKRVPLVQSWQRNDDVLLVELVTATPINPSRDLKRIEWLGDAFGRSIELSKLEEMYGKNYHIMGNSIFFPQEYEGNSAADYAYEYLSQNFPKPGEIFMIPGSSKQYSHDEVEEMCLDFGFFDVVIKLNSKNKTLTSITSDGKRVIHKLMKEKSFGFKNKEVKDWLNSYIKKNKKSLRVAITGCICISRGITISHIESPITHAIVSPVSLSNWSDMKQLMSRVSGYAYIDNKPVIVTTNEIWKMVIKMENMITSLQKRALSSNDDDRIITKTEINEIIEGVNLFPPEQKNDENDENDYLHKVDEYSIPSLSKFKEKVNVNNTIKEVAPGEKYTCSITGANTVQSYEKTIRWLDTCKITSNFPKICVSGKSLTRTYATYTIDDELIWIVRTLTRK